MLQIRIKFGIIDAFKTFRAKQIFEWEDLDKTKLDPEEIETVEKLEIRG